MGTAPLVRASTKEDEERVLVMSDFHVPYVNESLVDSAVALTKKVKPHRIVLNGDLLDMDEISRFAQPAKVSVDGLQEQFDAGHNVIAGFRKAAPDADIRFVIGNHEDRLERMLMTLPPFAGLRNLKIEKLLELDDLEVKTHDGAGFRQRSNFIIRHGHIVRKFQGYSAKAEMEASGLNGISGHTHRLGVFRHNGYTSRTWAEGGCFCHLNPTYTVGKPDWTNGAILATFGKSNAYMLEELQAQNDRLWYAGKQW